MLANTNQVAVQRLSKRIMKQNLVRNIFTILAIILTTFMFTTIFTIGSSLGHDLAAMMLREQGTKSTIYLQNPTKEQIRQAKKTKHIHAGGLRVRVEKAQLKSEESEVLLNLNYYDEIEFTKNFRPAVSDVKGHYPEKVNEVMLSQKALELLKIKQPEVGKQISIPINGQEEIFSLAGWFTDYCFLDSGCQGFVSEAKVKEQGLRLPEDGTLSISAKPGHQHKLLSELKNEVTLSKGQKFDSNFDVQGENGSNSLIIIVTLGLIGLIILLSGYLLIYNVMYISVTKDIQFYGMLKTIGTTPKQIRKIVKTQGTMLSVLGIPIGIMMGTLVSFAAVPYALNLFGSERSSSMPTSISFHPAIYMGTILFAILTVTISCRKPAKLAGKVSPVEAMKFNGQSRYRGKAKKGTLGGKLYRMAYRNVFREKKRAVLVFASLFMGTMSLLSVNAFVGSLDVNNYIDYYVQNDYSIYTGSSKGEEDTEEADRQFAEDLFQQIEKINGITYISANRSADVELVFDEKVFQPFLKSGFDGNMSEQDIEDYYKENKGKEKAYSAPVVAVSSDMIRKYNTKARQKMDVKRFEKGEICLIGFADNTEDADYMKGKTIQLRSKKRDQTVPLEVGSCPVSGDDYGLNIGYYWWQPGAPSCILISEAAMKNLSSDASIDNIVVDCKEQAEPYVTSRIKELTRKSPVVYETEIKSEEIANFKSSMLSMRILTSGISIVLLLIGVINFINVMLTGVFTRRRELAVMESVGMTKRQVQKMLVYEGLYYGVISIGLILTVGNAILHFIAKMTTHLADYAVYHYPFMLVISIDLLILAICMAVPAIVYRMITRESVTERIRLGE